MISREDVRQYHRGDEYTHEPWDYVDRPCMEGSSVRAIEYVLARMELDRDEFHVLEWGHGGSTAYFSGLLQASRKPFSWTALDWFELRAIAIADKDELDTRVGLIYREDYVGFPSQLGKRYDLVIVAGQQQAECLQQLPNITAEEGIVLLHDPQFRLHKTAARYCEGDFILGSSIWRGKYDSGRTRR